MSQSKNKINDDILKLYGKLKEEELNTTILYRIYKKKN